MNSEELRALICSIALSWVGTPYHPEARVKGAGVDCGLFIAEVFEEAGLIAHIAPPHYPPDFHLHQTKSWYIDYIKENAYIVEEPLPGDVATFQMGKIGAHAAIIIDYPKIVHARFRLGVIPDTINNLQLKLAFLNYYRCNAFKELE